MTGDRYILNSCSYHTSLVTKRKIKEPIDKLQTGCYTNCAIANSTVSITSYKPQQKGTPMLETKNLSKIYRPKKGVPVTALDKISLRFPDKGMIFLLGKSGSGKSTLLNLLGGLDRYDSGEIIIKGVSSKDFKQKHFDSYRNTYVGFIFQEYNVLEEFSVGANIALAIELQNRKATDEEITEILREVDLEGFGSRKPNELSGGQKQRVAIARALVKKPEIIMADEPTGALDSNTGRQVLDTLKKLSEKKLVIVVSHDREFAENYADRIIELADGRVISDVEVDTVAFTEEAPQELTYDGQEIQVPAGYHLTEEDRAAINAYIEDLQKDATVRIGRKKSGKKFTPTDTAKIKTASSASFHLIKSKLPMKNAFKIGASGLTHKKIRLVVTILLSCIAFGLFGLADTFGAYNHVKTCTNSIYDSEIKYASIVRSRKYGSGMNEYWDRYNNLLAQDHIDTFVKDTGIDMSGVYVPMNTPLSFDSQIDPEVKLTQTEVEIYARSFTGFVEITEESLHRMNASLVAGTLPDGSKGKNEIAISTYIFQTFRQASYSDGTYSIGENESPHFNYEQIQYYDDMIGKTLRLGDTEYTVTGVIDTGLDLDRYKYLAETRQNVSTADQIIDYALTREFNIASRYSLAGLAMVGEGHMDTLLENRAPIYNIAGGWLYYNSDGSEMIVDPQYLTTLDQVKDQKITWIDGEKAELAENEIIVTSDALHNYNGGEIVFSADGGLQNDSGGIADNVIAALKGTTFNKEFSSFENYESQIEEGYKVVGILEIDENNTGLSFTTVVSDKEFDTLTDGRDAVYAFAVGEMPEDKEAIGDVISYCYGDESKTERFELQNSVTYELDTVNSVLHTLADVFLYIGLGFALFAALMLANFISTSISYKKQEIGILRAIGSRGNDVFRIFFAESFIIAMINFALSAIGVFAATMVINYVIRHEAGILITILNFGPRQLLLLLAVSLVVAALASYLPVKRIASKRPIDAIRNR